MKTVLFVCVHNAGRSQMAEAFFNHLARGKAQAISAGTMPGDQVQPEVVQAMAEVGLDLSRQRPKRLTSPMIQAADHIVTMGCGTEGVCPALFVPTEDWGLEGPKGQPIEKVRLIRDEIRRRVEALLAEIGTQGPS
ncbi:MAG: arsenate reductase ArsC [Anaerolineae bacterium]|nr:arsenate reductase ArsC [Anaerolineae bacterium]